MYSNKQALIDSQNNQSGVFFGHGNLPENARHARNIEIS
jgi:hypothetical protein